MYRASSEFRVRHLTIADAALAAGWGGLSTADWANALGDRRSVGLVAESATGGPLAAVAMTHDGRGWRVRLAAAASEAAAAHLFGRLLDFPSRRADWAAGWVPDALAEAAEAAGGQVVRRQLGLSLVTWRPPAPVAA